MPWPFCAISNKKISTVSSLLHGIGYAKVKVKQTQGTIALIWLEIICAWHIFLAISVIR